VGGVGLVVYSKQHKMLCFKEAGGTYGEVRAACRVSNSRACRLRGRNLAVARTVERAVARPVGRARARPASRSHPF
jgi:hypothetical protein